MTAIQIMLVDDYELARHGLKTMLEMEPDLRVMATLGSAEELLRHPDLCRADVVILDVQLPGMDGIEAIPRVRQVNSEAKILMMSSYSGAFPYQALQAGADGYLMKGSRQVEIASAIKAILEGGISMDPSINRQMWRPGGNWQSIPTPRSIGDKHLSERQIQILELIKDGCSNCEIASNLNISEQTVKNHMTHIFDKLEARDRTEAVVIALRSGSIPLWGVVTR